MTGKLEWRIVRCFTSDDPEWSLKLREHQEDGKATDVIVMRFGSKDAAENALALVARAVLDNVTRERRFYPLLRRLSGGNGRTCRKFPTGQGRHL